MTVQAVDTPTTIGVLSCGGGKITITGLTSEEIERIRASMLGGHHWVCRDDQGHLSHIPSFESLPNPYVDEEMLPFWQPSSEDSPVQMELFHPTVGFDTKIHNQDCSFYIEHLCGYHYSAENYRMQAERLTSYGFICMRSPRDAVSGQYWEQWYLPGLWKARGALRERVDERARAHPRLRAEMAVGFLCRNVQFGSMNVSVQRAAMAMAD